MPPYYPPYVSGGGFVMTPPVARKLVSSFEDDNNFEPFPIDDAYLGICMQKARLTSAIRNNRGFKSWGINGIDSILNKQNEICKMLQYYTVHKMNPEELLRVWNEITDIARLGNGKIHSTE